MSALEWFWGKWNVTTPRDKGSCVHRELGWSGSGSTKDPKRHNWSGNEGLGGARCAEGLGQTRDGARELGRRLGRRGAWGLRQDVCGVQMSAEGVQGVFSFYKNVELKSKRYRVKVETL